MTADPTIIPRGRSSAFNFVSISSFASSSMYAGGALSSADPHPPYRAADLRATLARVGVKPLAGDPRGPAAVLDRLETAQDQFGVGLAGRVRTHDAVLSRAGSARFT